MPADASDVSGGLFGGDEAPRKAPGPAQAGTVGRRKPAKPRRLVAPERVLPPVSGDERVARVVLPTPVDQVFDYLIPKPIDALVRRCMRVDVPFGRRTLTGFVTEVMSKSEVPRSRLKPLLGVTDDEPLVDEGMMRLTQWIASYYACSWGEALSAVLPSVIRRKKALRTVGILRLAKSEAETLAHVTELTKRAGDSPKSPLRKQAKVLTTIATFASEEFRPMVLAERLGFSPSPIHTLRKEGWLTVEQKPIEDRAIDLPDAGPSIRPELNGEQMRAVAQVTPWIDRDEYQTFLLLGVTGSGKTEVYIRVLQHALDHGKGGIVLVPEIALTPQSVRRFRESLGASTGVAVLHSAMTDTERRREWKRITSGEARIVIGPRSAVFAPVRSLGVIIVDEEHEHTYKQDHTPRYHARDVAVMRCNMEGAVCILGSATPSLESTHNALTKKYQLIELTKRVLDRPLPTVAVVDMSEECRIQKTFAVLSNSLIQATRHAIAEGQQAVMFLNRRGYHTFFQCNNCRELLMCPNCQVPMNEHRGIAKAVCHYCYETMVPPRKCPACNMGQLVAMGTGTEKLVETLERVFEGVRIARMDSDVMKTREDYEEALDAFRDGEVDLLVGTQMIAKGLDYPNVTVVGVIAADLALHMADFRAAERTFQLLTQVAGRAGRGDQPGVVFVQSFAPLHPAIEAARSQDFWRFAEYELHQRKAARYPPFVRLVEVTVEARDERKGRETAEGVANDLLDLKRSAEEEIPAVYGPSPAPIAKLRGRHRIQILVKARDVGAQKRVVERLRRHSTFSESLRVTVDVDPVNLM